ncbi:MAG: GTP 3',8-cyclase MoaA [Thaumarchaeota archaeon]|nr:GTP 3',8-cyclase MoaA [Nitrososphaerota archaeon]
MSDVKDSNRLGGVASNLLLDSFGRYAAKLRVSVTDRCNFRCHFCMPDKPVWLDERSVLSFEEIARVTAILATMGIRRVRLSGGEPLVRPGVEGLVRMLTALEGIEAVSMTTNGALLKEKAKALKENGLSGITVSLHSLRPEMYAQITGTKNMLDRVLDGIREAKAAGLFPLKINCVVTRGCNDSEILDFAMLAYEGDVTVRFIEYMPFDGTKFWERGLVVSGREIVEKVASRYDLVHLERQYGDTSRKYRFKDGSKGEIGVITSMTEPFCGDCDRIRLKADGKVVPCLFSTDEYDLRSLLRNGTADDEIASFLRKAFWLKSEGVESMMKRKIELKHVRPMHTIGG